MTSDLLGKLLRVQQNMPSIFKTEVNSHFGNAYVSLDGVLDIVLPELHKEELLLVQLPTIAEGQPALHTIIWNASDPDDVLESIMLLMLAKDDPQGQGSALTYAKRYSLLSMLGLTADKDDDGEGAKKAAPKTRARTTQLASIGSGEDTDYKF